MQPGKMEKAHHTSSYQIRGDRSRIKHDFKTIQLHEQHTNINLQSLLSTFAYQTSPHIYMPVLGCAHYLQNGCSDYNFCLGPSSLGLMPFDGTSLSSLDNTL